MSHSTDMCPLCEYREIGKFKKTLEDKRVCKKCYYGLANRRQLAFIIDSIIFRFVFLFVIASIVFFLLGVIAAILSWDEATIDSTIILLSNLLGWIVFPMLFFLKDGFWGYSIGKRITGVRVVNAEDIDQPIGFKQSLKRNLILIIPILPIVIAFTLVKGRRMGDFWAKTRVVWVKRLHMPFYTSRPVCHRCQYDLRGSVADACPECGEPIDDENKRLIETYQTQQGMVGGEVNGMS